MDTAGFSVEETFLIPSYSKLPISIERGEGLYVWDGDGNRYLDLYGGHAVSLVGHSHPRLVKTLATQGSKLMFYSSVAYNSARGHAAEDLVRFVDRDMQVFFSNSGAEANENALKVAQIVTGRRGIVSFEGAFHGRTKGAIAVTGIAKYRREDDPFVRFARFGDLEDLKRKLDKTIGCAIFESIQSLSGVRQASPDYFHSALAACREAGALVIFDEIQTGLGRCGVPMYFQKLNVEPDILTLAKGLAGGFPIGATLVRRDLVSKLKVGDLGSTFGGGPLAASLLSETLAILRDEALVANANVQGETLRARLREIPGVLEVRGEGLLIGIKTRKPASKLVFELLARKILVGGSLDPDVIRLLPPLSVTAPQLELFVQNLKEVV